MSFEPDAAQLQALRAAKRFREGLRPAKINGEPLPPTATTRFTFSEIPSQVLNAEIGHLCGYEERPRVVEDLCNRGYLKKHDGYPKCLWAPMEYRTEDGARIFVHDKYWSTIDVLRPGNILPDGRVRVQTYLSGTQGHIVFNVTAAAGAPADKRTAPKRGPGPKRKMHKGGPGSSYELQPEGFRLLDQYAQGVGKQRRKPPAWERLEIVKSDTGNDIARLDGKEHRLTGANDASLLELLQTKRGEAVLGTTLETDLGERPARIYDRLPARIRRIIDKPGQRTGKKGYRMR